MMSTPGFFIWEFPTWDVEHLFRKDYHWRHIQFLVLETFSLGGCAYYFGNPLMRYCLRVSFWGWGMVQHIYVYPRCQRSIIVSPSLISLEQSTISQRNKGLHTQFLLGIPLNFMWVGMFTHVTAQYSVHVLPYFMCLFAGLWKVCEKYRKLMNELAQVSACNLA